MGMTTGPLHALPPPQVRSVVWGAVANTRTLCALASDNPAPHSQAKHDPRAFSNAFHIMLCCCRAVANLAVTLLSLEESEGRLLDFLARARNPMGKPLFDTKYALRLAKDRNR